MNIINFCILIIFLYTIHFFLAVIFFSNITHKKLDFEQIKIRRKNLNSFLFCGIMLILPYKIRECIVTIFDYQEKVIKRKIQSGARYFARNTIAILIFLIYFLFIPLTMFLKRILKNDKNIFIINIKQFDIINRY